jgi:predicted RNA-binding Zn-ribbon protein involved in translation (DUF1610 family)
MYFLSPGKESSIVHQAGQSDGTRPANLRVFDASPQWFRRLGFAVISKPRKPWDPAVGDIVFGCAVPYWFLCLLAVPLPLMWTMRLRRRRRVARRAASGLCFSCGYDLRATPDAGGAMLAICPECGAATLLKSANSQTSD